MLFLRFFITTFIVFTLFTPALAGELAIFKESIQQQDEEKRTAMATRGSLPTSEAEDLRTATSRLREFWR